MKRVFNILIILILFLKALWCFGQENSTEPIGIYEFVIIADPEDSFVNIRNTPSIKGRIDEKLQNGKIMFAFEQKGNWILAQHSENKIVKSGYVHKSRVKKISSLKKIKNTSSTENSISFDNENIYVEITMKSFIKPEHTYKLDDYGYIKLIDNNIPWGIDGGLPRTEYKEIVIKINGKNVTIPVESLKDLYEPNLSSTSVYYDAVKNNLYIVAGNSDGAGAYSLTFVIENKKYKERILEIPF